MAGKILCPSLEFELLHGFVSCLVQRNNPTLDVCWLVFCVIMIIKTFFYFLGFLLIFQFCLFWLLSKFGNMVIWLYSSFYLLCMLIGPEKKSGEMFFCFFFQQNSRWPTNHMLLRRAWTASPICSKEATCPGHMLIRIWCDSDITFSHCLHKNLVTVLYFSIINVLCGGVETQALPLRQILFHLNFQPLEVVSRYCDPQFQVHENYS